MTDRGAEGARIALWIILIASFAGLGWLVLNLSPTGFGSWFVVILLWGIWTSLVLFVVRLVAALLLAGSTIARK